MTVVVASSGTVQLQLETLVDPAPAALPPRVRVTVTGVASSTAFTLTRLCEGESWTIPEYAPKTFTDSDVSIDWAAPLNRPVLYTLSTAAGALVSATITLTSATAIIQDPIQPDKFLEVYTSGVNPGALTMAGDALKSADYSAPSTRIQVMGSRYPVAIGGQVAAASKVSTSVASDDAVTAAKFRDLRAGTPILLLRTTADMVPLPALSYLLADMQEQPVNIHIGGSLTRWNVTGDLIAAVKQAAISGYVTYDQVQQLLAGVTYNAVQTKYSGLTYLDVQKDPLIYSKL
ncbi:MAG: hypothetical protein ABIU18_05260 [Novosphingobium sp.]